MPITKNNYSRSAAARSTETLFEGRVVRIEQTVETRNWSDTLDYTDSRSTNCVYALVWLGTNGLPPRIYGGRPQAELSVSSWNASQVRDLEFHEQFAWVDCTNIFSDRNGFSLTAAVDGAHGLFGEPLMWANLIAWEGYHAARRAEEHKKLQEETAARQAAEAAAAAKRAARAAKKAAADEALKAEAEALLARTPAKGTRVTVNGFTGTLFWKGVSKYYGKWNARVGVKDARGNVQWIPAAHWAK